MNYEELKRLDHTYLWHPFTLAKQNEDGKPKLEDRFLIRGAS